MVFCSAYRNNCISREFKIRPARNSTLFAFRYSPAQAPRVAAAQGPQVVAAAAARGSWRTESAKKLLK
uniref:Uncharacterized protein n=1 Tax=Trichogramma kaykai TaxID=54128 RepID=A0ABD2XJL5_9HYME